MVPSGLFFLPGPTYSRPRGAQEGPKMVREPPRLPRRDSRRPKKAPRGTQCQTSKPSAQRKPKRAPRGAPRSYPRRVKTASKKRPERSTRRSQLTSMRLPTTAQKRGPTHNPGTVARFAAGSWILGDLVGLRRVGLHQLLGGGVLRRGDILHGCLVALRLVAVLAVLLGRLQVGGGAHLALRWSTREVEG